MCLYNIIIVLVNNLLSYFPHGGKDIEIAQLLPPWGKVGKGVEY